MSFHNTDLIFSLSTYSHITSPPLLLLHLMLRHFPRLPLTHSIPTPFSALSPPGAPEPLPGTSGRRRLGGFDVFRVPFLAPPSLSILGVGLLLGASRGPFCLASVLTTLLRQSNFSMRAVVEGFCGVGWAGEVDLRDARSVKGD